MRQKPSPVATIGRTTGFRNPNHHDCDEPPPYDPTDSATFVRPALEMACALTPQCDDPP